MKGYSFDTAFIRQVLPHLQECYGFDEYEIGSELSNIITRHHTEKRFDKDLYNKYKNSVAYGLNVDEEVIIPVSDDFDTQYYAIESLCQKYNLINNEFGLSLLFMATIFNRERNDLTVCEEVEYMKNDLAMGAHILRADFLRLFIVLNKDKPRYNKSIKVGYTEQKKTVKLENKYGLFACMLNEYIKEKIGKITVEEAQKELELFYSDRKGRKSKDPYLNYIIHGTYNLVALIFPSEKVTVEQCTFLLEYLKAIQEIKEGDTLDNVNLLQSTVRSLISSSYTPVERHIKLKKFKSINLGYLSKP